MKTYNVNDFNHLELCLFPVGMALGRPLSGGSPNTYVYLAWVAPILVMTPVINGMLANALWDLVKYSFNSIHRLIIRCSDNQQLEKVDNEKAPLTNRILPEILEIARNGYREHKDGAFKTSFYYCDNEGREICFDIDKNTQGALLETNLLKQKLLADL